MAQENAHERLALCLLISIVAGSIDAAQFTTQPSNISVLDGSEKVDLQCTVNDNSAIYWYKDDSKIEEDFTKYTFTNSGLRIKPVIKSDAGKYYCKTDEIQSRMASLTVKYICKDGFLIKSSGIVFREGNATLTCDCAAIPSPSYIWNKDGNAVNFTGRELIITNAQKHKNDGKYSCIAKSGGRQATSGRHNLVVLNCSPAKAAHPPDDKIPFVDQKPLTVRCDATGDPKPVVDWYRDGATLLRNTSRIQILSNGSLHFTFAKASDLGSYHCVVSSTCYKPARYKTKLVFAKVGIFSPMKEVLSRVGGKVSVTCTPPRNSFPAIDSITWQRGDGSPLSPDVRFKVRGNTLEIETAQRSDSGNYTCVAENIAGNKTENVEVLVAVYPQVIQDPVSMSVVEDAAVKLECKFSGDPPPTITWEKDEKSFSRTVSETIVQSGTMSTLTIRSAEGSQSGKYRCVAKLKHVIERTKEATLTVKEKVLLEKSGSEKFDLGTVAKLQCRIVAGTGPFDIRWMKAGVDSSQLPRVKVEQSKFFINKVKMSDTGNYSCHINNSFSSASLTFTIHIYGFAKIVLKPRNVTVKENGSALFNCNATGMPTPTIYWYYGKTNEPNSYKPISTNNSGIQRLPNNSLVLSSVTKNNQGWYRCLAGNPGNLELEAAYLKVGFDKAHSSPTATLVPVTGKPTEDIDEHETDDMGKTVGIAVGCAGAYIILVVGLMIYCKGRRARQAKNKLLVNGEDVPLKPDDGDKVEVVKAPEVLSNAKEYPRESLETLRTLGSGTYGIVFLAKASEITEGENSSIVVVQSLTSEEDSVKKEFMRKMQMLSLKHEHIAKMLGVCREEEPMYLISEYLEQGDLKTVMRDSSSPLTQTQKLNICAAVASGMNYLTNYGHVHKDLAARNCLVNKAFDVKISFLSLNQGTYPKEYYRHKDELIPLRWMAPEAINGDYSDMSDVWAFGILMWEVYSEGMLPYEERPDEEVLHSVDDDLRLTKPDKCPGKIYKMMEKCWADDKEDRMTFAQLCEDISEMPRESDF